MTQIMHTFGNNMKILSITFLFLVMALVSCSFIKESYVDISQAPRMQHLIGRCLELKQDAFLYQYPDTPQFYGLDIPGHCSMLPATIDEYLRDPANWENTDSNAKMGK